MKRSIRAIDDLRAHCRVDDDDCWHWLGGSKDKRVTVWLPACGTATSLGAAICWLTTGGLPKEHEVWRSTCGHLRCGNPAHRRAMHRRAHGGMIEHTVMQAAAAAAAKRAKSRISDADVSDIRDSSGPLRLVAERYGISISYASELRRGTARREHAVSVFSWVGRIPMR